MVSFIGVCFLIFAVSAAANNSVPGTIMLFCGGLLCLNRVRTQMYEYVPVKIPAPIRGVACVFLFLAGVAVMGGQQESPITQNSLSNYTVTHPVVSHVSSYDTKTANRLHAQAMRNQEDAMKKISGGKRKYDIGEKPTMSDVDTFLRHTMRLATTLPIIDRYDEPVATTKGWQTVCYFSELCHGVRVKKSLVVVTKHGVVTEIIP